MLELGIINRDGKLQVARNPLKAYRLLKGASDGGLAEANIPAAFSALELKKPEPPDAAVVCLNNDGVVVGVPRPGSSSIMGLQQRPIAVTGAGCASRRAGNRVGPNNLRIRTR